MTVDADPNNSDVLGTLREAMAGPLSEGARTSELSVNGLGKLTLESGVWEPLVLVAFKSDLADEDAQITAKADGVDLPPLRFGSFLPLFLPPTGPDRRSLQNTELTIRASVGGTNVPVNDLRNRLVVQLLSGAFGRLYYIAQAEQVRFRRLIRQIANARSV